MTQEPKYMDEIDALSARLRHPSVPLPQRIIAAFRSFENLAERRQYDILSPIEELNPLRQHMRTMITLMYEWPDADPVKDCEQLRQKNALYGGSWCRRGGSGAFHMLARKADRFEEQLKSELNLVDLEDTVGDLRRYLILCEAWQVAQERDTVAKKAQYGGGRLNIGFEELFQGAKVDPHCSRCKEVKDNHPHPRCEHFIPNIIP